MKVVFNNLIPFPGFLAITIFPFVFVREKLRERFTEVARNHENCHGYQQVEVMLATLIIVTIFVLFGASPWWFLVVPFSFYALYILEWCIRILVHGYDEAYRNISAEQEAYMNETDLQYLKKRKPFAWVKFLFRKTYNKQTSRNAIFDKDDF